MAIRIEDLAAVQKETTTVMGYLCWYSVGEALYERELLRNLLRISGLTGSYLPNEIRSADAFRRATKAIEKFRVPVDGNSDVYENYIIRDVVSNKEIVQRNLVVETVDRKDEKLSYSENEAILRFERKSEAISTTVLHHGSRAEELVDEACKLYQLFRYNHNGQAVRGMVMDILKSMSPTPVRPSGGVYFVPVKHEKKLRSLIGFLSALEKGEGFIIPLINSRENKDMIRAKVQEHLEKTLNDCTDALKKDEIPKGHLKAIIDEAKRVVGDFKDYREVLTETIDDMESHVELIRQQIQLLIEK